VVSICEGINGQGERTEGVSLAFFGEVVGSSILLSFLSNVFLLRSLSFPSTPSPSCSPEVAGGAPCPCPSFQVISCTFLLTSPTLFVSFFFSPVDPEPDPEEWTISSSSRSCWVCSGVAPSLFFLVASGVEIGFGVGSYLSAELHFYCTDRDL
jgi:hypothetical protein